MPLPDFAAQPWMWLGAAAAVGWVLGNQLVSAAVLMVWLIIALLWAFRAARTMRAV